VGGAHAPRDRRRHRDLVRGRVDSSALHRFVAAGESDATERPAPTRGTVLAKLTIPSLRLSTTVLEGSDDATLGRGSGHIEDTPLPGEPGNVGIAGHRDTVFRPLKRVKAGDALDVTTADRVYHYTIRKTFIVEPKDVYVLDPTERPTLTLVTCYPFEFIGHAPHRFIVQADLIAECGVRNADCRSINPQ
jgi:sortase A